METLGDGDGGSPIEVLKSAVGVHDDDVLVAFSGGGFANFERVAGELFEFFDEFEQGNGVVGSPTDVVGVTPGAVDFGDGLIHGAD